MPKRGGSKGRKKQTLGDLSREILAQGDAEANRKAFIEQIANGSDMACALIACALVDNALRNLILAHMRQDIHDLKEILFDSQTAPLQSFSSRITLAHAMGLIDDEARYNLNTVRSVRNVFAHSEIPRSFAHPLVANQWTKLKTRLRFKAQPDPNRSAYAAICLNTTFEFQLKTVTYLGLPLPEGLSPQPKQPPK